MPLRNFVSKATALRERGQSSPVLTVQLSHGRVSHSSDALKLSREVLRFTFKEHILRSAIPFLSRAHFTDETESAHHRRVVRNQPTSSILHELELVGQGDRRALLQCHGIEAFVSPWASDVRSYREHFFEQLRQEASVPVAVVLVLRFR